LNTENDFLLVATLFGGIDRELEDFIGSHFFVLAESVGGFEFVSTAESGGNGFETLVESLIVESEGFEFGWAPVVGHGEFFLQKRLFYLINPKSPMSKKICGITRAKAGRLEKQGSHRSSRFPLSWE
jgi:hypothetical protein